jgi:hypothetical protein
MVALVSVAVTDGLTNNGARCYIHTTGTLVTVTEQALLPTVVGATTSSPDVLVVTVIAVRKAVVCTTPWR